MRSFIIADEVTDVSNREELSLVVRYLYNKEVKEVFVDFIEVERITGKVLGESILQWLTSHNISLQICMVSAMMSPQTCRVLDLVQRL